jgi:hypothetical protein
MHFSVFRDSFVNSPRNLPKPASVPYRLVAAMTACMETLQKLLAQQSHAVLQQNNDIDPNNSRAPIHPLTRRHQHRMLQPLHLSAAVC